MSAGGGLVVRDARPDERGAVRELTLRAYAELAEVMAPTAWAGLDRAVRAALDGGGGEERIVAERDGALLGSVMLFPPAADAYGGAAEAVGWPELRLLAVSPDARGEGIGQALVDECVRRARGMGAGELGLHTSESLRAAIRMYERMGFERAPERDFRPPGAELVMGYRLLLGEHPVPERRSARLLIVDPEGRLLLFRYDDGRVPPFWATPGGQLVGGETYEEAAARELAEETGFDAPVGALVRTRDEVFAAGDLGPARWIERYFLVRAPGGDPERRGWTEEERRTIRGARWWSLAELRTADEPVRPAWLPDALASLLADAQKGRRSG